MVVWMDRHALICHPEATSPLETQMAKGLDKVKLKDFTWAYILAFQGTSFITAGAVAVESEL